MPDCLSDRQIQLSTVQAINKQVGINNLNLETGGAPSGALSRFLGFEATYIGLLSNVQTG